MGLFLNLVIITVMFLEIEPSDNMAMLREQLNQIMTSRCHINCLNMPSIEYFQMFDKK